MANLTNRYALALFDLSLEAKALDENIKQAHEVINLIKTHKLDKFFAHPHIPKQAKTDLLQKLFTKDFSKELMGFLRLCLAKNRETIITPALIEFIELGNRHKGLVTARVVSATALGQDQLKKLEILLKSKLKKDISIETEINQSLLGGFYIQVDGLLIDCTIKTKLKDIKDSIKKGVPNDY